MRRRGATRAGGGTRPRRSGAPGILGAGVLVALAVLLGWGIYAGVEDGRVAGSATPSIAEVVADPERYGDRELVVSGPVLEPVGPNAVLIGKERLLVLAAGLPRGIEPGDVLQVVGVATRFERSDVEARLGVRLDVELDRRFAGAASMVAERLSVEPAPSPGPRRVSAARLAEDPSLAGVLVTVTGRVSERLSPMAFVLEDAVVVLAPASAARRASVGSRAEVSGRAGRFDPVDLGRQLGIRLDDPRYRPWLGRPAVSATSVIVRP